jgi:Zn-dependent protease with chaperone function
MNSWCRRNFSKLVISLLFTCCFRRQAHSTSVSDDPFDSFARSGDDDLDEALIIELKRICQVFDINPGFKYVDQMNAFATAERVVKGTDGMVYLGLPLVKKLLEKEDGGAGVAGVCAHECAHIFQYKKKVIDLKDFDDAITC